jgi:hypothetical protein
MNLILKWFIFVSLLIAAIVPEFLGLQWTLQRHNLFWAYYGVWVSYPFGVSAFFLAWRWKL